MLLNPTLKTTRCLSNIFSALTRDKMKNIITKIKKENPLIIEDVIFTNLFKYFPPSKTISDVNQKLDIFNNLSVLNPKFEQKTIKITPKSSESILLTNKNKIGCGTIPRIVIHFHSVGLVAGKPSNVAKSLSHFYENSDVTHILVPALKKRINKGFETMISEAFEAYRYVFTDLKANSSSLIFSASSTGAIFPLKIMSTMHKINAKNSDPKKINLPKLHFPKGPYLILRPDKQIASSIILISPSFDVKFSTDKINEPFLTKDTLNVIRKAQNRLFDDKMIEKLNTSNMTEEETIAQTYMLCLTCDQDPGYDSLLRMRSRFTLKENRHWFNYKNMPNKFHLCYLSPFQKTNSGIINYCNFFIKSNSNL